MHIWEKFLEKAIKDEEKDVEMQERLGLRYAVIRNYYKTNGALPEDMFKWLKPFETLFDLLPVEKKHILDDQYRMEEPLSDLIGTVFYNRKFNHKKPFSLPLKGVIPSKYDTPLLWIDTPHVLDNENAGEDSAKVGLRDNQYELEIIILFLQKLKRVNNQPVDFVILTPYNNQKDLFLESPELKAECVKLSDTKFEELIRTVDEYQGSEADLTIVDLVRNNTLGSQASWGFMTDAPRLNVMFSRTKSRQVIIGCSSHILRNKDEPLNKFLVQIYNQYKIKGKFILAEELKK